MPTAKKVQFNVRLPEDVAERFRVVADVEEVNPSDLAVEAFSKLVDQRLASKEWQSKHKAWADKQRRLLRVLKP